MNAILPDVSLSETATLPAALDWSACRVSTCRSASAKANSTPAARQADVQVDLPAATAKGIHMSRSINC